VLLKSERDVPFHLEDSALKFTCHRSATMRSAVTVADARAMPPARRTRFSRRFRGHFFCGDARLLRILGIASRSRTRRATRQGLYCERWMTRATPMRFMRRALSGWSCE